MKSKLPIFVFAALFICMPIVHAVGGQWYLLSPKMILRLDSSDLPYVASIGLRNTDSDPVSITINPPEQFNGVIFFEEEDLNFTLESDQTVWINFTVNPENPRNVSGDVMVLFTSQIPNVTNAALASEIHVVIQEDETVTETQEIPLEAYYLIAAIIVIIAVYLVWRKR